jgi:hypothetical protein
LAAIAPASAWAGGEIRLGPSDGLAVDQPHGAFEVIDVSTPGGPRSLGPDLLNTNVFDTGASTVMVAGEAVSELDDAGLRNVAKYMEQGVAGFTEMDVSDSYEFDFAGDGGVRRSLPGTHFESSSDLDLGGFYAVVGMPGMRGTVLALDMSVWQGGTADQMGTDFGADVLPGQGHRYTVPLSFVTFPETGQENPTDPLPPTAPLPFVDVLLRNGDHVVHAKFVLDTGAQLSVLSTQVAFALGLDKNGDGSLDDEADDHLDVGGIGGTVSMPLLSAGEIVLPTTEGKNLVWTSAEVGVLDIDPSIAGVFGMDLLTSGWFDVVTNGTGSGFFQHVQFDFRAADAGNATLVLDLTAERDVTTAAPPQPTAVEVRTPAPRRVPAGLGELRNLRGRAIR